MRAQRCTSASSHSMLAPWSSVVHTASKLPLFAASSSSASIAHWAQRKGPRGCCCYLLGLGTVARARRPGGDCGAARLSAAAGRTSQAIRPRRSAAAEANFRAPTCARNTQRKSVAAHSCTTVPRGGCATPVAPLVATQLREPHLMCRAQRAQQLSSGAAPRGTEEAHSRAAVRAGPPRARAATRCCPVGRCPCSHAARTKGRAERAAQHRHEGRGACCVSDRLQRKRSSVRCPRRCLHVAAAVAKRWGARAARSCAGHAAAQACAPRRRRRELLRSF